MGHLRNCADTSEYYEWYWNTWVVFHNGFITTSTQIVPKLEKKIWISGYETQSATLLKQMLYDSRGGQMGKKVCNKNIYVFISIKFNKSKPNVK